MQKRNSMGRGAEARPPIGMSKKLRPVDRVAKRVIMPGPAREEEAMTLRRRALESACHAASGRHDLAHPSFRAAVDRPSLSNVAQVVPQA